MRGRHRNTTSNNCLVPCFFLVDCILVAAVVVLWYFMVYRDVTFTLNLPTIVCSELDHYSYPTRVSLIPEIVVYVLTFVLPPIVFLFGEAALALYQLQGGEKQLTREKNVITFGIKLHAILRRTVRFVGIFILGGFVCWILTRAGQLILGRPAPNFFSEATCLTPCSATTDDRVFTVTDCTDTKDDDARQSFPSLYASLSAYAAVSVGIYVTNMMRLNSAHSLRPFIALASFSVPFLLGIEQVATFNAHWTDVIAGWLLGGAIAVYLIYFNLDGFYGPLEPMSVSETTDMMTGDDFDIQDEFVMENPAMRNGGAKPLQMNGLRQSQNHRDREPPMRETYLDRGMEDTR